MKVRVIHTVYEEKEVSTDSELNEFLALSEYKIQFLKDYVWLDTEWEVVEN